MRLTGIALTILWTVCFFLPGGAVEAQGAFFEGLRLSLDGDAPVQIVSERLELDPASRVLLFTGNVVVTQPGLTITCGRLEVITDEKGGILSLDASGGVALTRDTWSASAGRLRYSRDEKQLILQDNPAMRHEGGTIVGRRMTVQLDQGRLLVEDASTHVTLPGAAP